jgi:brefeldin A-resistance guanine nucleotide exchange factor 1
VQAANVIQEEAVPESLKNVILVMSNGGFLVPPDKNPQNEKLWTETWKRLDRFLPKLMVEIFPDEAKNPAIPVRPSVEKSRVPNGT